MRHFGLFMVLVVLAVPSGARACSVPVFRYALERWKPTPYEIHIFHRGELSEAQRKLVKQLEDASGTVNVNVSCVDLAGKVMPYQQKLWQLQGKGGTLPWVIAQYPGDDEKAPPAWAGSLDAKNVDLLLDSPARRELVKRLCRGETAVWVLLNSGDRKADDAAANLLDRELTKLAKTIELPKQEDDSDRTTDLPLTVSFSVLRLDRTARGEELFIKMLLQAEEDLDKFKGPIVFPIFGRGRALYVLYGKELSAANLDRWASFLCGPCSCQVKELNPGVDLLVKANWNELLEAPVQVEPEPRPAVTAPPIPPGPKAVVKEVKAVKEEEETPAPPAGKRGWLCSGSAALLVLLSCAWVLRVRSLAAK